MLLAAAAAGDAGAQETSRMTREATTVFVVDDNLAVRKSLRALLESAGLMYDLKYRAVALMRTPTGDGKTAGPTFEPDAVRMGRG